MCDENTPCGSVPFTRICHLTDWYKRYWWFFLFLSICLFPTLPSPPAACHNGPFTKAPNPRFLRPSILSAHQRKGGRSMAIPVASLKMGLFKLMKSGQLGLLVTESSGCNCDRCNESGRCFTVFQYAICGVVGVVMGAGNFYDCHKKAGRLPVTAPRNQRI